ADVERRLAEAALLRVELAQVREVIHPALLGARADVEVHALNCLECTDRVFTALEDVVHGIFLQGFLPALAVAARHTPAVGFVRTLGAGGRLAPLDHGLVGEGRAFGDVDQRVDRARVVYLVGRNRRGVAGTRPGMGEHLPFEGVRGHARDHDLGDTGVLVTDQALDVLPRRMRRVGRGVERIERDVAGTAGGTDQEGRLDRAVLEVGARRLAAPAGGGDRPVVAFPGGRAAVELCPRGAVEARVREL